MALGNLTVHNVQKLCHLNPRDVFEHFGVDIWPRASPLTLLPLAREDTNDDSSVPHQIVTDPSPKGRTLSGEEWELVSNNIWELYRTRTMFFSCITKLINGGFFWHLLRPQCQFCRH